MAHVATTLANAGQQLMQAMLEKNLVDLVKGLRACRRDREQQYISQCIAEIKEELRSRETAKKARALLKLVYLHMLGYEMSWAAFYVVEAMSDSKFSHKRIGYLAASQSFRETTEVLVLTIQLFKKDLASQNQYEVGLATNCLANICTLDLGRDLGNDVLQLLKSSKPYVRKKAVLALYKVILQFPEALRPAFERLKEKLDDSDPSVVSAAVNVFCELARKSNPKNYLPLAPVFFKILTTSSNNWVLIKIVKLMTALVPLEPRLAKKLVEPLTSVINSTPAKSLLYECVNAVTACMTDFPALVKLACEKLRLFVEDPDQNQATPAARPILASKITPPFSPTPASAPHAPHRAAGLTRACSPSVKYLGLLGLLNLMRTHPQAVVAHKSLIVSCLHDEDVTIRNRALDLVTGMMDRQSSVEVLRLLTDAVARSPPGPFRDATIEKIVATCGADSYERVTNFQWYLQVLADLSRVAPARQSAAIAEQMVDIAVRVKSVRAFAAQLAASLVSKHRPEAAQDPAGAAPVLGAAAWILGEFPSPDEAGPAAASYVQAALKVFVRSASQARTLPPPAASPSPRSLDGPGAQLAAGGELASAAARVASRAGAFAASADVEVQERACTLRALARLAPALEARGGAALAALADACREELAPVAPKAQRKVPVPEGLDLDTPICEPEPEEPSPVPGEAAGAGSSSNAGDFWGEGGPPPGADTSPAKSLHDEDGVSYRPPAPAADRAARSEKEAAEARRRREGDPFYLPGAGAASAASGKSPQRAPEAAPEADAGLLAGWRCRRRSRRGSPPPPQGGRRGAGPLRRGAPPPRPARHARPACGPADGGGGADRAGAAMPEGASASDDDAPRGGLNDVDLTRPGSPGASSMPTIAPYARPDAPTASYSRGLAPGYGGAGGGYGGAGLGAAPASSSGGGYQVHSGAYQAQGGPASPPFSAPASAAGAGEPERRKKKQHREGEGRHRSSRSKHRSKEEAGEGEAALIDVGAPAGPEELPAEGGPDRNAYAEIGEGAAAAASSHKHRSSKGSGEHRSKHKHRSKKGEAAEL
eukprot:tig00000630_g2728.t1